MFWFSWVVQVLELSKLVLCESYNVCYGLAVNSVGWLVLPVEDGLGGSLHACLEGI